jgi:hypothetical protein
VNLDPDPQGYKNFVSAGDLDLKLNKHKKRYPVPIPLLILGFLPVIVTILFLRKVCSKKP